MTNLSLISERIGSLGKLSTKQTIFIDDLPSEFKPDLKNFIAGETLSMLDGKIIIGNNLYKKWLMKLRTKGFDYEIDFKLIDETKCK